jgi:hypothetical protein
MNYGNRHQYGDYLLKSDAEYRFARLLDTLLKAGEIVMWSYEPSTFWFEGIRRGTVSYKPDFLATWKNGEEVIYEVKDGIITSKDVTKWKRMADRFPQTKLVLVYPKEPNARKRDGKANPKWLRIESGKKYLDHVWYVKEDYKKFGI